MTASPCPIQLVADYDRACLEAAMAFSYEAQKAAETRRNIFARLILSDNRISLRTRTRVAADQCRIMGSNEPMKMLRSVAA